MTFLDPTVRASLSCRLPLISRCHIGPEARDSAWPMVATPELLEFDNARLARDVAGVDRMLAFEREVSTIPVKRADLDARPSRRSRLSDTIGHYVFHAEKQLEALRLSRPATRSCKSTETPSTVFAPQKSRRLDRAALEEG